MKKEYKEYKVRVSKDLGEVINRLADEEDRTLNGLITKAIKEYIVKKMQA